MKGLRGGRGEREGRRREKGEPLLDLVGVMCVCGHGDWFGLVWFLYYEG